jgi:circadian clock protein KaiC
MPKKPTLETLPSGVPGLDDIMGGGFAAGKMHLLSGGPGTGKTTLSLQFMADGIRRGERCLYIGVAGGGEDYAALARAMGITLDSPLFSGHTVEISEEILAGPEERIFPSSEAEISGTMTKILAEIRRVKPKRLVIDSLSDLQALSEDPVSYHRLILALRREFSREECTVLLAVHRDPEEHDTHLETMCHGVIYLRQSAGPYGPIHRRLMVLKFRRRAYRSGWHDFIITQEGMRSFPTLVPGEHPQKVEKGLILSGNAGLDALFGGGLNRGSSVAIIGPSGTGKTTMGNVYAVAAARRGDHAAIYIFDETEDSFRDRASGMDLSVDGFLESGLVTLRQLDVAEISPGEFTDMVRREVEEKDARLVVIDTLNGYGHALRGEEYLTVHLHDLLTYLSRKGVTTLITVVQHGVFGTETTGIEDISYLSDTTLLLRFFEHRGKIRRALSVVKKRRGRHETTIRELRMTDQGIVVGEPLEDVQGVLMGVPTLA